MTNQQSGSLCLLLVFFLAIVGIVIGSAMRGTPAFIAVMAALIPLVWVIVILSNSLGTPSLGCFTVFLAFGGWFIEMLVVRAIGGSQFTEAVINCYKDFFRWTLTFSQMEMTIAVCGPVTLFGLILMLISRKR